MLEGILGDASFAAVGDKGDGEGRRESAGWR